MRRFIRHLSISFFMGAVLSACGGSGGSATTSGAISQPQACSNCGAAVVSLTDAPGDFLSYIVNVVSLKLTRSDGTVVETVSVPTQVDFSQLKNLSEVISAQPVAAGSYVAAAVTLDYKNATIVVDNGTTGVTIAANQIINSATSLPLAAPNTTLITINVTLPVSNPLVVTANANADLDLDFNLLAANTILPSLASPMTVDVNPVLTASLTPDVTRQMRVRGALVSVNSTAGTYLVNVRPFNDANNTGGQYTVNTSPTTVFSINNTNYTGAAGLTQLATIAAGTVTAAIGSWNSAGTSFTATSVTVGSSVAGVGSDSADGVIVSRTGDTLVLANDHVMHADEGGVTYSNQITVTVGPATTVTEEGQTGSFTIADISVGQNVEFGGKIATSSSGNITLDATAGAARLKVTQLQGLVTVVGANSVTVNLQTLAGFPVSSFIFAGTGTAAAADAVPTAYTVSVPATPATSSLSAGAPVQFSGFVAPFGTAPPDFAATSLVNFDGSGADSGGASSALLEVRWSSSGITAPFATETSSKLLLSQATLQGSAEHQLRNGPQSIDPSSLTAGLQLVPDSATTNAQFAISHPMADTVDTFTTFAAFEAALATDLNGTVALLQIVAKGPYNATTGILSVDQAVAVLNN